MRLFYKPIQKKQYKKTELPRKFDKLSFTLLISRLIMQIIFPLQFKIAAKVQAPYLLIVCQFFCGAVFKYFSVNEQVGPVADGEGFVYIVVGN